MLFTDSSGFGYGAHLSSLTHKSLLTGYWDATVASQHITFKELKVVEMALTALGPVLATKSIALFSDSSTTVSVLKRLYTKSVVLRELLGRIIRLVLHFRLRLQPLHIEGQLNQLADILSRTV